MFYRALLIGIDEYDNFGCLTGCVNDVKAIYPLLSRNYDSTKNFDCQTLTSETGRVDRADLISSTSTLLVDGGADVAFLYFAGHGTVKDNDLVLVAQNGTCAEPGIQLSNILSKVSASPIKEIIIILDCCLSGKAGNIPQFEQNTALLRQGVAIITASRDDQAAQETQDGRGAFSEYLCGGLDGGAADVLGRVNLSNLYAYIFECFGSWDQRPMFKANIDRLHIIRRCSPSIPLDYLQRLPEFFPNPDFEFPLDSSYEPDAEPRNSDHEEVFRILQRARAVKLVEPIGAEHMYYAAMGNKSCQLTPLGKHYWRLIKNENI